MADLTGARGIAVALALVLAGAVVGAAAILTHARAVGLALGVVASLSACLALPSGWRTRLAFVVGWDLMLGYVLIPRPEGDYLISGDARGYTLLGLGLVLLLIAIVTLGPPIRRQPPSS